MLIAGIWAVGVGAIPGVFAGFPRLIRPSDLELLRLRRFFIAASDDSGNDSGDRSPKDSPKNQPGPY